jgi:hypothetical protein
LDLLEVIRVRHQPAGPNFQPCPALFATLDWNWNLSVSNAEKMAGFEPRFNRDLTVIFQVIMHFSAFFKNRILNQDIHHPTPVQGMACAEHLLKFYRITDLRL